MKDGVWEASRILPEGWVKASTTAHVGPLNQEEGLSYGYQWWMLPAGGPPTYAAIGYGGQFLVVVPSLELIAVVTGWNVYDKPELPVAFVRDRVLAAVRKK